MITPTLDEDINWMKISIVKPAFMIDAGWDWL